MPCFGEKQKNYMCKILLLDETELEYVVQKKTHGKDILEFVFKYLDLIEQDYFGLRFVDERNQTHWLEPLKSVIHQMKYLSPYRLYFSIKFYAVDPCKLHEEITRYQFFLQVKQDILQGRLPVPFESVAELGGYILQSELGDYDSRHHPQGYVSEFRLVSNQTEELENRIAANHKTLKGQVPSIAELNFLDRVKWMDMYGVDLHSVLGEDNVEYFLGLTPSGVIILRNKTKVGNYFWPRITKVYFKTKYFMIRVRDKNNDENTYGFELPSKEACKHLWKCSVEQHAFFRLTQVNDNSSNVFTLGSKFRYSGRTEREVLARLQIISRPQPKVQRRSSRSLHSRNSPVIDGKSNGDAYSELSEVKFKSIAPPQPIVSPSSLTKTSQNTVPESPHSVHSSVWEDLRNSKGGLYTSGAGSPRSVHSGSTKASPRFPRHKRLPSAGSDSDITSRRKHHSRKSSDNDSDLSNSANSVRSHSRSKSDEKHKHGRHKLKAPDYEFINSEEQWKSIQKQQKENHGPRNAVIKDLTVRKSGYVHSGSESEASYRQRKRTRSRTTHSRSRSRSHSPDKKGPPQEIKKHIEYGLVDSAGLTEDQLKDIPYTKVDPASKRMVNLINGKSSPVSAHTDISFRSQNNVDSLRPITYKNHSNSFYRAGPNDNLNRDQSGPSNQQYNHFWSQNSRNASPLVKERKSNLPSVLQEVQNKTVFARPPFQSHMSSGAHQIPPMVNQLRSSPSKSHAEHGKYMGRLQFTDKMHLSNSEKLKQESSMFGTTGVGIHVPELPHLNTRVGHHEMSTEL